MIALSVWHDGIFIADVSFACSSAAAELLLWQLGLCGRAAAEKRSWFCLCSFIFFLLLCPWLGRHDQGVLLLIRLRDCSRGSLAHRGMCMLVRVVNQEPSVQQCSAGDGLLGLGIVSRPSWMHACAVPLAPPQGSAKEAEEQGWRKWADRWLTELAPCLSSAPSFAALGASAAKSLEQVLKGKAAGTLRRHLPGWRRWCDFARCYRYSLVNPEFVHQVRFLESLAEAKQGAASCMAALRFVARLLGFDEWGTMLNSSVAVAWCKAGVHRRLRKEALPLPLCAVSAFEEAVLADFISGNFNSDTFLLVGFLLMIWGALRFSDIQRVKVEGLEILPGLVRGECWRTKSSVDGMPFGVLTGGVHSDWSVAVDHVKAHLAGSDFFFQTPQGTCASFSLF